MPKLLAAFLSFNDPSPPPLNSLARHVPRSLEDGNHLSSHTVPPPNPPLPRPTIHATLERLHRKFERLHRARARDLQAPGRGTRPPLI
ncbi:hypothetical protein CBOM_07953 [Ceraceosorus bombacis]|uniref:Uncharacterized protein n=1 Tax=Ceraceosorus bombacis TaxID=401625 RepID=A0A0N7LBD0_9BASI|nr:hypothetical protein CBOM_07953 [Ceraceosorus bombacis]